MPQTQLNFFATVTEKACTKCHQVKPASHFGAKARNPDGLRSWCNQCGADYQQRHYHNKDLVKHRAIKREHMARVRQDPQRRKEINERNNATYPARRDHAIAYWRDKRKRCFFWARATRLKGINAKDLARLWKAQRGKCALTGRRLNRTAQVDHILPLALGGGDEISNLQWTCAEVNLAKRNLTNEQFVHLCRDVLSHGSGDGFRQWTG